MLGHGIRRRGDGGARVRLAPRERDALRALPSQLRPILAGDEPTAAGGSAAGSGSPLDTVRERLFPPAYDDPEAEEEYRGLVQRSLVDERLAALDVFERTLAGGEEGRLGWTVDLDADEAAAWLSAINDTRLTLGAVIGITTEREWDQGPDEDDAASVLLYYLGWLQEELLGALSADLGE
jgi:hypothetical protein